ncbi:MAG: hypothetical protein ACT4OY_05885 [Alphaproteobacteria bacterium]
MSNDLTLPEKFHLVSFITPSIVFGASYEEAPEILIEKPEDLKFIKMPEDTIGLVIKTLPQNPPVFERAIEIGFKAIKIELKNLANQTRSEKLRIIFGNAISPYEEAEESNVSNHNDSKKFKYQVTLPDGYNVFCKENVIVLNPENKFQQIYPLPAA